MHKFSYWHEGLIFTIIFLMVMTVPCVLIAFLGSRLIDDLGQRPTRGVKAHLDMALPLLGTMVLSFGMLVVFYKFFSD